MRSRVLVIQHEDDAPAALFDEWLTESGVDLDSLHPYRGEPVPADLEGYDGLLVMGGAVGATDDDIARWLPAVRRLIEQSVRRSERPVLGICLGHQLTAVALGGRVTRNPAGRTLGLCSVRRTEAGRRDRLLGAVSEPARALHWNDDVVAELPPGAEVLARGADGTVAAARFGPLAWGVQFHPEVSANVVAAWAASARHPVGDLLEDVRRAATEMEATWRPLAQRFASLVVQLRSDVVAQTAR